MVTVFVGITEIALLSLGSTYEQASEPMLGM
jgi:hypothetical protein